MSAAEWKKLAKAYDTCFRALQEHGEYEAAAKLTAAVARMKPTTTDDEQEEDGASN